MVNYAYLPENIGLWDKLHYRTHWTQTCLGKVINRRIHVGEIPDSRPSYTVAYRSEASDSRAVIEPISILRRDTSLLSVDLLP